MGHSTFYSKISGCIFFLVGLLVVFPSCYTKGKLAEKIQEAQEQGYAAGWKSGYEDGRKKAKDDFTKKINSQKASYKSKLSTEKATYESELSNEKQSFEKQLADNKAMYEKKVKDTYNTAFAEVKKIMAADIQETITVLPAEDNSKKQKKSKLKKQKKRKKDWNDVISN